MATNMDRPRAPGEHGYINTAGVCMDFGGTTHAIIVNGKRYSFEFSARFGPFILNKDGSVRERQPTSERSPFLNAVCLWADQGHREKDGLCVWDHKDEFAGDEWVNLGGRHYVRRSEAGQ